MSAEKRIVMLTYGTRGDVEPFVALGVGLREAGYKLRIVGPAAYAGLAESRKLEFVPIEGNPDDLARALSDQAGLNWIRMMTRVTQHVIPLVKSAIRTIQSAVREADLILHSFLMTDAGHTFASMQRVPDISAQFFPIFLSTTAFPAVALPDLPLGKRYRRASHTLINGVFRYGSRLMYRILRGSIPAAPDLAPWPFQAKNGARTPILFAYSAHILPRPSDWPSNAHISGYWQLPVQPEWAPDRDLVHFLESGEAPIYFGPGSVRTEKLLDLVRIVVKSARAHGQRVLLNLAPDTLSADLKGADVYTMQGVPHSWLFPKMRFILHHGGAGTTGAAATAGIPNTAVPFTSDQAFWARRIQQLGLGPKAPPARKLTAGNLQGIFEDVLSKPTYQEQAEVIKEYLRKEDGVTTAIGIIQEHLGI